MSTGLARTTSTGAGTLAAADRDGGAALDKVDAARSGTIGTRASPRSAIIDKFVDTDSKAFESVAICFDKYSCEKYFATNAMPTGCPHHTLEIWLMWAKFVVEQWFLELCRSGRLPRQQGKRMSGLLGFSLAARLRLSLSARPACA